MNKKIKNVLVVALSTVNIFTLRQNPNGIENYFYTSDKDKTIRVTGFQTNEGITKILMHQLKKQNRPLDAVIMLVSQTVASAIDFKKQPEKARWKRYPEDRRVLGKRTHLDFYKREIIREEEKLYPGKTPVHFCEVRINDHPGENDVSNGVIDLAEHIINQTGDGSEVQLYIDSNGAQRYILSMLVNVVKMMQGFNRVHCQEIFSVDFDSTSTRKNNPMIVTDQKDIYDVLSLTSGIDEFVNYGRAEILRRYFGVPRERKETADGQEDGETLKMPETKKEMISKVMNAMADVSEDFQLCRSVHLTEHLEALQKTFGIYDQFDRKRGDQPDTKAVEAKYLQMRFVIRDIRDGYKDILNLGDSAESIPQLITWCLDHDYIQQALTFYCERIPDYLVRKHYIYCGPRLEDDFEAFFKERGKGFSKHYVFINTYLKQYRKNFREVPDKRVGVWLRWVLIQILEEEGIIGKSQNGQVNQSTGSGLFLNWQAIKAGTVNALVTEKTGERILALASLLALIAKGSEAKDSDERQEAQATIRAGVKNKDENWEKLIALCNQMGLEFSGSSNLENRHLNKVIEHTTRGNCQFMIDKIAHTVTSHPFLQENYFCLQVQGNENGVQRCWLDGKRMATGIHLGRSAAAGRINKVLKSYHAIRRQRNFANHANDRDRKKIWSVEATKTQITDALDELAACPF